MDLAVVTPKTLTVKIGGEKAGKQDRHRADRRRARSRSSASKVDKQRQGQARPRRRARATATRSSSPRSASRKRVDREAGRLRHRQARRLLDVHRPDRRPSAPAATAAAHVIYQVTFRNGKVVARKVLALARAPRSRSPRSSRSAPRTARRPQPRTPNFAGGSSVWDRIAAVRVRRQLGDQHRQRLLRRPAVQPRHLAGVRRLRPSRPEQPRGSRSRSPSKVARRQRRLRRLAGCCGAGPAAERRDR